MTENQQRIPGFCALCKSKCGCISTVENGRLIAVDPDPDHPTGAQLCAKGRAAPDIVHSKDRISHPMKRTNPKGADDPGWQRISWDEALDLTAQSMGRIAQDSGAESVAFALATASGTAMSDHISWVERLIRAFGSCNTVSGTEICNWHKDFATSYTFGAPVGGPDFDNAWCIILWGHNPSTSWLVHAAGAAQAKSRGAKLVVVDPRCAGLANKADQWLRVRPGTDGALALGIAGQMIENGWFDKKFVANWTNGSFLVRIDTGRMLRADDIGAEGRPQSFVAWDEATSAPVICDPRQDDYFAVSNRAALAGTFKIMTKQGEVECQPAFGRYAALCEQMTPEETERITGVEAQQIRDTAKLIWQSRPVCYYAWSGVAQQTNATQTDRAISLLYALTGSYDAPGGNLDLQTVPANNVSGADLVSDSQREKALGLGDRPIGPPRDLRVTSHDFYRAVLDKDPYAVKALIAFGTNLLFSHPNPAMGIKALKALEFHVHADLFMSPSAAFADVILPVTTPWEHEALRMGFEDSQNGQSLVQLRQAVVEPQGEARSDSWIVFELAKRLGLDAEFFGGDMDDGFRHILEPSGISLEDLRDNPRGIAVDAAPRRRKYAGAEDGKPAPGFKTPSKRVEIYSEVFLDHGQHPLPEFVSPLPDTPGGSVLAEKFPLTLTSFKPVLFCQSQHRGISRLRAQHPDPVVEIHPHTAAQRGIADHGWVWIETPDGTSRARARFVEKLERGIVCAEHGWWQGCAELGLEATGTIGPASSNYNALIGNDVCDPISGSVPLRSYPCQISSA
ncbi:MAG: molybdopterin-dependent oxidoreductase [Alphaproteobacteria bacterium]|nr:molybdopterin-dependent oxidoreductase [Alphaproteobacteria bacterium]MBT5859823.1 molybdopterin-dependent oxidoreductase [Alphaproteobacteria bacterium]